MLDYTIDDPYKNHFLINKNTGKKIHDHVKEQKMNLYRNRLKNAAMTAWDKVKKSRFSKELAKPPRSTKL